MPLTPPAWYRDDRPLLAGEVAVIVLESIKKLAGGPDSRFQVQSVVFADSVQATFGNVISRKFAELNRDIFGLYANAFVNRLFRAGILDAYFIEGHPMSTAIVPASKWSALDHPERINEYELSASLEALVDPDLKQRIANQISISAHLDTIVRESVTVVEDRLRTKAGIRRSDISGRSGLAGKVFNPQSPVLKSSPEPDVQKGVLQLFEGFFLAIANDTHHTLGEYSSSEVVHIAMFSDFLLSVLERSKKLE